MAVSTVLSDLADGRPDAFARYALDPAWPDGIPSSTLRVAPARNASQEPLAAMPRRRSAIRPSGSKARLSAGTSRPQDVIGLHFFSPANVMRLLEIVRGAKTAKDVLATAMQLAKKIGKVAVISGVCDGFIGNVVLGFVFIVVWRKTGRLWPLIIAHGVIDSVALT